MPVQKCSEGRWRIGSGGCMYVTKAEAEIAYRAYLAKSKSISGTLQEMAADEIKEAIDPQKYEQIKQIDKNPLIKAFVIGHEGESTGKKVGFGRITKRWLKPAVEKIYNKLKLGTKIFKGHAATNDHSGRTSIGEIIGKTLKTIKDKLSVVALMYIKPEYKADNSNVSSIETTFLLDKQSDVVDIGDITGVAIDNSANSTPGFPGATLQGALQEFAKAHDNNNNRGEGENKMTIDEMKAEIKANKLKVDDLFDRPDIDKVDFVIGYKESKKRLNDAFDKKSDEFAKMETQKADWDKKEQGFNETIQNYKVREMKTAAVGQLEQKMVTVRKLDERQQKFVQKNWDKFKPTGVEKALDREMDSFIDNQLDDFKEMSNIFQTKDPEGNTKDGVKVGNTGAGVGAADVGNKGAVDLKNPKNNPLIP